MRKSLFGVSDQVRHNRAEQKISIGLKFQICKVVGLYYLCGENKGTDQLRGYHTLQLINAFVFAYAKSRFCHDAAHLAGLIYRYFYINTIYNHDKVVFVSFCKIAF